MFPDVCLYMHALLSFLFHMLLMSQCAAEQVNGRKIIVL